MWRRFDRVPVTTNHQAPRTSTRGSWRPMVSSEGGTGYSTMGAERLELAQKSALYLDRRTRRQMPSGQQSARNWRDCLQCPFTTRDRSRQHGRGKTCAWTYGTHNASLRMRPRVGAMRLMPVGAENPSLRSNEENAMK